MGTARLKRSSNVSEWTSLKPKTVAANLTFVGDSVKIFDLSENSGFHVFKFYVLRRCHLYSFCCMTGLGWVEDGNQNLAVRNEIVLHGVVSLIHRGNWEALFGIHNMHLLRGLPSHQPSGSSPEVLQPDFKFGLSLMTFYHDLFDNEETRRVRRGIVQRTEDEARLRRLCLSR